MLALLSALRRAMQNFLRGANNAKLHEPTKIKTGELDVVLIADKLNNFIAFLPRRHFPKVA